MGQKTNPNIFRLGISKTWKTEFFEKKQNELPLYIFKDIEIKSYIERFLETHGILLQDYKQHYSGATLNLYISYFVTHNFMQAKDSNSTIFLINKDGNKKKVVVKNVPKTFLSFSNDNTKNLWKSGKTSNYYKLKKYYQSNNFKKINKSFDNHNFKKEQITEVLKNMFKVLSLFTNNKMNISVIFNCVNKNFNFLKFTQKKNFILLQRFRNTVFLKEGLELLFYVTCSNNSANLLASFIASQIRKTKQHKFFLSFLKQLLTIMLNSTISKVKGIKVVLKGRLNGTPRAKHKIITIGNVPVQSISEKMDYAQTTVHNANGSYGIKVWIIEN